MPEPALPPRRRWRRALLPLALLAAAAPATAAQRSFTIRRVDSIRLTDVAAVEIVTGSAAGVTAQGDAAALERLQVSDAGGILEIAPRDETGLSRGALPVRLRITVPMINHLSLRGGGSVTVNRVTGPGITVALAGPGRIDIAEADVRAANFSTAGSGSISAAGRCQDARAASTGSGDIDIARLHCATLSADTGGAGDIRASASTTARITITGAGNVAVSGGARCTVSAIGSGRARCS